MLTNITVTQSTSFILNSPLRLSPKQLTYCWPLTLRWLQCSIKEVTLQTERRSPTSEVCSVLSSWLVSRLVCLSQAGIVPKWLNVKSQKHRGDLWHKNTRVHWLSYGNVFVIVWRAAFSCCWIGLAPGASAIGAEIIGHGWARAHPLFVSGGHRGAHGCAQAKHIKRRDVKYSFTKYQQKQRGQE